MPTKKVDSTVSQLPENKAQATPKESLRNIYTVKKGDKISEIATKQGISVRKLVKLNDLSDLNLEEGTKLKIR